MTVLIDIGHTPQLNFYKHLIEQLAASDNHVYVTVMKRGRLPKIVQHELNTLNNVEVVPLGRHRMNKISAILESNLLRILQMLLWILGKKIDVVISNGYIAHLVGKIYVMHLEMIRKRLTINQNYYSVINQVIVSTKQRKFYHQKR